MKDIKFFTFDPEKLRWPRGRTGWSNSWPIVNVELHTAEWWQAACRPAANAFAEVWVGTANDGEGAFF